MSDPGLINKVSLSGLISLDLEEFYPSETATGIDFADYLYEGLILKEKDFREKLQNTNWEDYRGKKVYIFSTADAIIPTWAFMLLGTFLAPYADYFFLGTELEMRISLMMDNFRSSDLSTYKDERVVVKGCSKYQIPEWVYVEITRTLQPIVKSLMFGEPCSTVPLYKKKVPKTV